MRALESSGAGPARPALPLASLGSVHRSLEVHRLWFPVLQVEETRVTSWGRMRRAASEQRAWPRTCRVPSAFISAVPSGIGVKKKRDQAFSLRGLVVVLLLSLLTPFCRLGNKKIILREMQASFKSGKVDYNLLLGKC